MAIAQVTTGVTLEEYRQEQAIFAETNENFPGRLIQVCYGDEDNLHILTVYESEAARDAFIQSVLAPVLQRLGIAEEIAERANYKNETAQVHKVMIDAEQCELRGGNQECAEDIPEAARHFIGAINSRDTDGLLALFSGGESVRFTDAGHEFTDLAAIRDFNDRELIGANGHFTTSRVERSTDAFTVYGHYHSDRYTGPAKFVFVLDGEKLVEVNIEPE